MHFISSNSGHPVFKRLQHMTYIYIYIITDSFFRNMCDFVEKQRNNAKDKKLQKENQDVIADDFERYFENCQSNFV